MCIYLSLLLVIMTLILFDVDGTLTPCGEEIKQEMVSVIEKLSLMPNIWCGIVGGGTYAKILSQMGTAIKYFKYIFSECGAIVHIDGTLVSDKNMLDYCDRTLLNNIIVKSMSVISAMPIIFHGQQTDFRKGLVYVSPPGMQATNYERKYFLDKDSAHSLRKNLLTELKSIDTDNKFDISYGGAVGIAICPKGWNKSQVVTYLKDSGNTDTIYYFGDRTEPDGNDYPIYSHSAVIGVSVTDYTDTISKINKMFIGNAEYLS